MNQNRYLEHDIRVSCGELKLTYRRLRGLGGEKNPPYEYVIWDGRQFLALKCKVIKDKYKSKSFPFKRYKDSDREAMLNLNFPNSKGYILINFRWLKYKGRCFALEINDFIRIEEEFKEGVYEEEYPMVRKSLPIGFLRKNAIDLPRYKNGWDLRLLFDYERNE